MEISIVVVKSNSSVNRSKSRRQISPFREGITNDSEVKFNLQNFQARFVM